MQTSSQASQANLCKETVTYSWTGTHRLFNKLPDNENLGRLYSQIENYPFPSEVHQQDDCSHFSAQAILETWHQTQEDQTRKKQRVSHSCRLQRKVSETGERTHKSEAWKKNAHIFRWDQLHQAFSPRSRMVEEELELDRRVGRRVSRIPLSNRFDDWGPWHRKLDDPASRLRQWRLHQISTKCAKKT